MSHIQPNTDIQNKLYKIFTGIFTQAGTAAPTVTVIHNTWGQDITWTRFGPGRYLGTVTNSIGTGMNVAGGAIGGMIGGITYNVRENNEFQVEVQSLNTSSSGVDDNLENTFIEMRLYS